MNRFFILLIIVVGLIFIYKHLLNQSKSPTGWVGIVMMKLWNKVYLPWQNGACHSYQQNNFTTF